MAEYTQNFNLVKPSQEDFYNIEDFNENFEKIDQQAVKRGEGIAELIGGTLANRPAPGIVGRYYFAQDTGEIFLDIGTEWVLAAASRTDFATHLADGAHLGKNEGAKVIRSTNQSLSSSWYTDIEFESVVFDRGNLFDTSDKTKLTVPSDGIYLASATCVFAPSSAGHGEVCFKINGSRDYSNYVETPDFSEYRSTTITLLAIYNLKQGDFIGVSASRSVSGSDITRSSLTLIRVG